MFWRKVDKVICSIHSLTNWNWLLTKSWSLSVSFDSDSISFFRFTCNSILNSIWAIFFEVCRILWVQQTSNELSVTIEAGFLAFWESNAAKSKLRVVQPNVQFKPDLVICKIVRIPILMQSCWTQWNPNKHF